MNIHYKTKRHFELGFRAAYPILVVQILLVWFNWSGDSLTYISGVFPVLSVTTYLGSQLEISRSYLWGAIIGSIFGTIASYSAYVNTTFQILLLFLGLIVLNRISFGDRATKVIVSLFYFLGTLLPNISDNGYPPGDAIASLILLMFVPCAVSIVTMLIPFPKLASDAAISNVRLICTDMDEAIILLLRSFEDDLYADVHRAKCATTLQRLEERLEFLRLLTQYSATEAMFLPYNQLPEALILFIGVNTQLLNDMYGLRSVLKEIIPNYTQNLYCVEMQRPFILYAIHIRAISRLVQTRFSQLGVWHQLGLWQHTVADDHLYGLGDPVLTKSSQRMKTDDNLLQHSNKEFQEDLADNFESKLLEKTTTKLGVLLRRLAQRDLSIDDQLKSFDAIMTSFSDARNTFLGTFQVIRLKYIWKDAAVLFSQKMGLQALEDIAYMTPELAVEIAAPVTDADAAAVDNVRQDNKKFGHMNYTPRNAVFCRLMLIRTLLESYRGLFIRKPVLPFAACRSGWNFLIACLNNNFESCVQILEAIAIFCRIIRNVFYNLISLAPPLIQDEEAIVNWNELRSYLQPAKIAGVIAILSYFVIFPVDGVISSQDALWSCFAVIVTRQDYVSSTFFTSVQRLEGTLVGAFFAVIVITALGCANSGETNCDPGYKVPILTVWAGLCCMFKEGVQHGYSATVAAFTPIILITNPTGTSGERAGVRVFMQMAGISLFLVVDILVWPNTTARLVTESLAKILSETLVSFSASVAAIRSLVEFFYRRNTIAFEPLVTEDSFPGHSDGSGDNINKGAAVRNRAPLTALTEMLEASEQIDESSISMPNIESDDTFVYRKPDFRMRTESAIMFDTELGMATEIQVEMTEDNDGMGHREIALALDLEECNACLQLASEGLKKAQKNTKTFKTLMLLSKREPDFLHRGLFESVARPFPIQLYKPLSFSFDRVCRAIEQLLRGISALDSILGDLEEKHRDDVKIYLQIFAFQSYHLLLLSDEACKGIQLACTAFQELHTKGSSSVDLSALVALSRSNHAHEQQMKEFFASSYERQRGILTLDPAYVVTWQNSVECIRLLMAAISRLGNELLIIREVDN